MELINFNEFSNRERYEIIKNFLVKMKDAGSINSARAFFEHYLRKFYKVPENLIHDIAYCQRAMKSHLLIHQTIVSVFGQQEDADPEIKNSYLRELEDILTEVNAECQYLLLLLQDDIDQFCLAFTEQNLQANEWLLQDIVSDAIVPLVLAPEIAIQPHSVAERPTEEQLLSKYFIINGADAEEAATAPKEQHSKQKPTPADNELAASRLNLQEALRRSRLQAKDKGDENRDDSKERFLRSVGLCTHMEHEKLKLSRLQGQKRRAKPKQRLM
ncbi:hypothetical protein KR018_007716 [Drosophila ironensis]|nr:hypothetical protein KR018_007716 [Drosophila ironensis]